MRDDIRKSILAGTREPNGKCVTCGEPVCKENRFLCQEHHNAELMAFFRKLSKDVLSLVVNAPLFDHAGNCYGVYPADVVKDWREDNERHS